MKKFYLLFFTVTLSFGLASAQQGNFNNDPQLDRAITEIMQQLK